MTAFRDDDAYRALTRGVAFVDRSDRGRLDVLGPDRARFLHNLTTNDVKRLAAGGGQEAFVTSLQGKTLGYVTLLACDDRILLRADPGALPLVLPHLEKYGVFDDVALAPSPTFEFHLAGPRAEDLVRLSGGEPPDADDLAHRLTTIAGRPVRVVREAPTGRPGLTLIGDRDDAAHVGDAVRSLGGTVGLAPAGGATFEAMRVEAGTPAFGVDVSADNLPQEVGRDARAISFVKGCYLGQETVARLDALGHVNKLLRGLRLEGDAAPPPGTPIEAGDRKVGAVTSSAFSPGWGAPLALGYVRTSHAAAGTAVRLPHAGRAIDAVVCDLPMIPPAE